MEEWATALEKKNSSPGKIHKFISYFIGNKNFKPMTNIIDNIILALSTLFVIKTVQFLPDDLSIMSGLLAILIAISIPIITFLTMKKKENFLYRHIKRKEILLKEEITNLRKEVEAANLMKNAMDTPFYLSQLISLDIRSRQERLAQCINIGQFTFKFRNLSINNSLGNVIQDILSLNKKENKQYAVGSYKGEVIHANNVDALINTSSLPFIIEHLFIDSRIVADSIEQLVLTDLQIKELYEYFQYCEKMKIYSRKFLKENLLDEKLKKFFQLAKNHSLSLESVELIKEMLPDDNFERFIGNKEHLSHRAG